MGTMTDDQIRMLAHLAAKSRPFGSRRWDEPGVVAMIRKLIDKGFGMQEVIDRTFAHAWDAAAHTPGTMLTPKQRVDPLATGMFPARKGENECRVHPGQHADRCSSCAADRLLGDETPPPQRQEPPSYDEKTGVKLKHRPAVELKAEHEALPDCDSPTCHFHRFARERADANPEETS